MEIEFGEINEIREFNFSKTTKIDDFFPVKMSSSKGFHRFITYQTFP